MSASNNKALNNKTLNNKTPQTGFRSLLGHLLQIPRKLTTGPSLYQRKSGVWLSTLTGFAMVFNWFEAEKFIASGDTSPFIQRNLLTEIGTLWNHAESGAGSVTYLIARAYRIFFEAAVLELGGTSAFAQRLYFSALFGLAAGGVAYLASSYLRRPAAVWAAGVFSVANPFLFTRTPNILIPIAIGVGGWAGGILVREGRGVMRFGWLKLGLLSLLVAPMAYNPPMLAVLAGTTIYLSVISVVGGRPGALKRVATTLTGGAAVGAAVNLWWLVALYHTLFGGLGGGEVAAVLDVTSWQWTHRQNSIPAVFNLSANHAWALPQYTPATLAYDNGILSRILYVIPALATTSAVVVRRRKLRRVLWMSASLIAVLVFAGKGLHAPLAEINLWAYRNLPGYWMLREPAGKLGPTLVTLYAVGLGAVLEALWRPATTRRSSVARIRNTLRRVAANLRAERLNPRQARIRHWAATAVCALGVVAGWPMLSGTVIPTERPIFPSAHVQVPEAWYEAADWINTNLAAYRPGEGAKVMTLPVNDYYQMPTDWGYYGVDQIPASLLEVPMVNHQPGGYYGAQPGYSALLEAATLALYNRDAGAFARIASRLGVSHVILRKDIDVEMVAGRTFADPELLSESLTAMGLTPVFENEVAAIYAQGDGATLKKFPGAVLAGEQVLTDPGRLTVALSQLETTAVLISLPSGGQDELETVLSSKNLAASGRINAREGGDEFEEISGVQLVEAGAAGRYASLSADGEVVEVSGVGALGGRAGDVLVVLGRSREPLAATRLADGERQIWLPQLSTIEVFESKRVLTAGGSCNEGECVWEIPVPERVGRVGSQWGYLVTVTGTPLEGRVSLSSPCIQGRAGGEILEGGCWTLIPVEATSPDGIDGDESDTSRSYLVVANPEKHVVEPEALIVSAAGGTEGVVVISELVERGDRLPVGAPTAVTGDTNFTVPGVGGLGSEALRLDAEVVMGRVGALSDCNRVDDTTMAEAGLSFEAINKGWVLGAERHSACVGQPFEIRGDAPLIEVSVDITRRRGGFGRLCVYAIHLRRCLPGPSVSSMGGAVGETIHYQATFQIPAGERQFEVFTYADSEGIPGRTEMVYENLSIRPSMGHVRLEAAETGFEGSSVVVLEESYSDGWVLEGRDGREVDAIHVVADGWANGWVVSEDVDITDLVVRFAPQKNAAYAVIFSLASVALILLGAAIMKVLTRTSRGRSRSRV